MNVTLTVEGCAPWDGDYDCDGLRFNQRELHRIKLLSDGIRAGELVDALDSGDAAAFVAVTSVILARHGKSPDVEELWDAPAGSFRLVVGDDPEDDAVPLPAGGSEGGTTGNDGSSTPGSGSGSES